MEFLVDVVLGLGVVIFGAALFFGLKNREASFVGAVGLRSYQRDDTPIAYWLAIAWDALFLIVATALLIDEVF